jgi:hypothetical protein
VSDVKTSSCWFILVVSKKKTLFQNLNLNCSAGPRAGRQVARPAGARIIGASY